MRILFLCVGNAARSQMAEGIGRKLLTGIADVCSAGSQPTIVNPMAIQVLKEIGIDISNQKSKSVDSIDKNTIDLVITLCAEEVCPIFPDNVKQLHWPISDPVALGSIMNEQKQLALFREIRDELKKKINLLKGEIFDWKI